MTEEMALDNLVNKIINEFKITKEDLTIQVTDMKFTGISQEITVELIPIPKPKYPSLVEKKRMGGQVWFKDEGDRTCWHYYFSKRRSMHD